MGKESEAVNEFPHTIAAFLNLDFMIDGRSLEQLLYIALDLGSSFPTVFALVLGTDVGINIDAFFVVFIFDDDGFGGWLENGFCGWEELWGCQVCGFDRTRVRCLYGFCCWLGRLRLQYPVNLSPDSQLIRLPRTTTSMSSSLSEIMLIGRRIFDASVGSARLTGFRGGGMSSELDEPAL